MRSLVKNCIIVLYCNMVLYEIFIFSIFCKNNVSKSKDEFEVLYVIAKKKILKIRKKKHQILFRFGSFGIKVNNVASKSR